MNVYVETEQTIAALDALQQELGKIQHEIECFRAQAESREVRVAAALELERQRPRQASGQQETYLLTTADVDPLDNLRQLLARLAKKPQTGLK